MQTLIEFPEGFQIGELWLRREDGWDRSKAEVVLHAMSEPDSSSYEQGYDEGYDEGYREGLAQNPEE